MSLRSFLGVVCCSLMTIFVSYEEVFFTRLHRRTFSMFLSHFGLQTCIVVFIIFLRTGSRYRTIAIMKVKNTIVGTRKPKHTKIGKKSYQNLVQAKRFFLVILLTQPKNQPNNNQTAQK